MKLAELSLLDDENINSLLVNFLKENGLDIIHVNDVCLGNTPDFIILDRAYRENWVMLTLDDDFGTLVFRNKQAFVGIIRLHPGHLVGDIHIPTLAAILEADLDYQLPFLLIAEKKVDRTHIRYRNYDNSHE
jgi:predicted nuclease of predicted toxin-antitoxin system